MISSLSEAQSAIGGFSVEEAVWDRKSVHKLSDSVILKTNVVENRSGSDTFTYSIEVGGKSIGGGSMKFNDRELLKVESEVKNGVMAKLQQYKERLNR